MYKKIMNYNNKNNEISHVSSPINNFNLQPNNVTLYKVDVSTYHTNQFVNNESPK